MKVKVKLLFVTGQCFSAPRVSGMWKRILVICAKNFSNITKIPNDELNTFLL